MNQPNNRRRRDTQSHIRDAMLALLEEKEADRITVHDVCLRAGINRSTFYRHYVDIYALMADLEREIQSGIYRQWMAEDTGEGSEPVTQAALCRLLTYIKEYKTFYRAYLRTLPSKNHSERMQQVFDGYLQPLFENYGVLHKNHMHYYYRYTAAGLLAVVTDWLEHDTPESPEEIARILYAMLRVPRQH